MPAIPSRGLLTAVIACQARYQTPTHFSIMGKKYSAKSVMKKAEKAEKGNPGVLPLICCFSPFVLRHDQQIILNLDVQCISPKIQWNQLRANPAMGRAHHLIDLASHSLIKHPAARLGPYLHVHSSKNQQKPKTT